VNGLSRRVIVWLQVRAGWLGIRVVFFCLGVVSVGVRVVCLRLMDVSLRPVDVCFGVVDDPMRLVVVFLRVRFVLTGWIYGCFIVSCYLML
jgi:hypothetical protein